MIIPIFRYNCNFKVENLNDIVQSTINTDKIYSNFELQVSDDIFFSPKIILESEDKHIVEITANLNTLKDWTLQEYLEEVEYYNITNEDFKITIIIEKDEDDECVFEFDDFDDVEIFED